MTVIRTNIDIDQGLLDEAMALTGLATKHAAVEDSLRQLVLTSPPRRHRRARGTRLTSRYDAQWPINGHSNSRAWALNVAALDGDANIRLLHRKAARLMIKIVWFGEQYVDAIPLDLIADEGCRKFATHEMIGPRNGRYLARCSVSIEGPIAIFDYGGIHRQKNEKSDVDPGRMKLEFSDVTRRSITSISWSEHGLESFKNFPRAKAFITQLEDVEDENTTIGIEGTAKLVAHIRRERKPGMRKRKIMAVLKSGQILRCEACGLGFDECYGPLGQSACEIHHRLGLALGEQEVSLASLATLCANCHRVIHGTSPMLSVEEFAQHYCRNVTGTSRRV